ncbi:Rac2d, Rho family GTPase [Monocercomonoides exilis]|uniref:Rac2d, Rho family GTPase n=1 Tax=Monocercomonoides exilis TaxID=2049356 RepID=UPI00355AB468|nr:Rac2d, Rho family GTPase [Monocercomonoides exilis]|eukprot:MONOS_11383.1-p1 / transcript=MONOS_11383.1 / gene=MONOS_11383 / organism=Monocercomonoides_exilis_PA203 / gene_product=Rac2d, Rho family GTPase / transcript_product=Rac2d, Rho family GTPase / location=Mono_scaffold00568:26855-27637(-) / protein_length=191 / sequence_SO=supercontig / SO=protein_coding / is_pseudo=false
MSSVIDVKCVAIGDNDVGKFSMLASYTQNKFTDGYIPTLFDNFESIQVVDGKTIHLQLWNTAAHEDFKRSRYISYPDTEVFLICFSISDPVSFQNVEEKWIPEIKDYIEGVPIVLVGTKADLRESPPEFVKLVPKEDAEQMVKRLGFSAYVECSAKTQKNLSEVFETAARLAIQKYYPKETKESGCCTIF